MPSKHYKETFAINQSAIKDFRFKSPRRWKRIFIDYQLEPDKDDEKFVFGDLVDCILFTPKELEERFFIADVAKIPKGGIEKIISRVYEGYSSIDNEMLPYSIKKSHLIADDEFIGEPYTVTEYDLSPLKAEILQACIDEDWQGRWKDDTRVNKVINEGTEYFRLLDEAKGKEIITTEVNFDAIDIVGKLRKHPDENIRKYFIQSDRYQNLYQVEIFLTYKGTPIKFAIDIIHLDHQMKTRQVVDFKTAFSAFGFLKNVKQFGYCDQISFYDTMLMVAITGGNNDFQERYNIEEYWNYKQILPINIVIDRDEKTPYIYEYNATDLKIAKEGNEWFLNEVWGAPRHNHKIKKGWETILEEISWHMKNNKWEYPVEYYQNDKIEINLLNN